MVDVPAAKLETVCVYTFVVIPSTTLTTKFDAVALPIFATVTLAVPAAPAYPSGKVKLDTVKFGLEQLETVNDEIALFVLPLQFLALINHQ